MHEPLRRYVTLKGGIRVKAHRGICDNLVDMAVEEFPCDADLDKVEEVLRARMRVRVRREYNSVIATILLSLVVNFIVKIIVEWWFSKNSHRVLIRGWRDAMAAARLSTTPLV